MNYRRHENNKKAKEQMPEFAIIASGLRFPEGPIAFKDGSIIVVEIAGRALTRILPNGTIEEIAQLEGGPNGAAMGPDGWCYVCNSGGWEYNSKAGLISPSGQCELPGWIERIHVETGAVQRLYDGIAGIRLQAPNDLVFDSHGGFWFTDHGKHNSKSLGLPGIFYGRADGSELRQVISGMITPNGIGLSPDGRTLYVAETITRNVFAFDVGGPGQIKSGPGPYGGRLVMGLPGKNYLDSLAMDNHGHICVASLDNGGIWDIAPDGKTSRHIPLPDKFTTNICFGGPELQSAFVTLSSSGRVARFQWSRPGLALNY